MRRRRRVSKRAFQACFAAVAGLAVSSVSASEITSTWSGNSGDWTDATQWSTNPNYPNNGTPSGVEYDALINAPGAGAYTVSLSTSITTDSVTLNSPNATLSQTGGTLTTGAVNISAGTYSLSGGKLFASSYNNTGGTFAASTSVTLNSPTFNNAGGTIEALPGGSVVVNLTTNGTLTTPQLGTLAFDGGSIALGGQSLATIDNTGQTLSFQGSTSGGLLSYLNVLNGALSVPSSLVFHRVNLLNVQLESDITESANDTWKLQGGNGGGHTINDVGGEPAFILPLAGATAGTLTNVNISMTNGTMQGLGNSGGAVPFTIGSASTIEGYGVIGVSNVIRTTPSVTNLGVISANANGQTLTVNPVSFSSSGTLQAMNGGFLFVEPNQLSRLSISGTLAVDSQSSIRIVDPVTLVSGSTVDVGLGSNGQSGIIGMGGPVIQNGVSLNLCMAPGAVFSGPYEIIQYGNVLSGTFSQVTPGFVVDYSQPGEILVTAIPEPASGVFVGAVLALQLRRVRQRKKSPS